MVRSAKPRLLRWYSNQDEFTRLRPAGLEPATDGLENRCSIRLSYGRIDGSGTRRRIAGPATRVTRNAPGRIRTCDLRFRKPPLYPPELRARTVGIAILVDLAVGCQRHAPRRTLELELTYGQATESGRTPQVDRNRQARTLTLKMRLPIRFEDKLNLG